MDETTAPLGDQRHLFDLKDGVVFLNAASKSALLKASVEAGKTGAAAKGRPWAIDEPARYVQADDIRDRFASLIGASGDDIAIQPAASYGITTAAKNLTASYRCQTAIPCVRRSSRWHRAVLASPRNILSIPT